MIPGVVIWYGGKGRMVNKILPLLPSGTVYCEPYCGAASIFFARQRVSVEVLNDINHDLINLLNILKDDNEFQKLAYRLRYTPYSRSEFRVAIEILSNPSATPLDRAWAFFVRQNQSFAGRGDIMSDGQWGTAFKPSRGMASTVSRWHHKLSFLDQWHERLSGTIIHNEDAIDVIQRYDSDETVFYIDPPYHPETWNTKTGQNILVDSQHHSTLITELLHVRGAVVLSCYWHDSYSLLVENGWERFDFSLASSAAGRTRRTSIHGKGSATIKAPRTEVVLRNERAKELMTS